MLPPCRSGGIVDRGPVSGATPTSPQNGTIGTRTPGRNSARSPARGTFVMRRYASVNSSVSSPKPGMLAVHPQSAGSNSRRSIWSVSPGAAPRIAIGPLTWSTRSKSRRPRSSIVDVAVSWPPEASSMSNSMTVPLSTVSIAGIAGSHARWKRSRATWSAGLVCMGTTSSSVDRNAPDQTAERPKARPCPSVNSARHDDLVAPKHRSWRKSPIRT